MHTSQIIVRASAGILVALIVPLAQAQTGVRMNPRGGVRIGSPSAGARSVGNHSTPIRSATGGNSYFQGGYGYGNAYGNAYGGLYGRNPHSLDGNFGHLDSRLIHDNFGSQFGDFGGFMARGAFDDGDFSLQLHLGGLRPDLLHRASRRSQIYPRYPYPRYPYPRYYYPTYPYYGYGEAGYAIGYGVNQASPAVYASPPAEEAMPEPKTPLEVGIRHLWLGEIDDAILVLRGVVSGDDGDAEAQRMLSLALISGGRLGDGVAMMRAAYGNDQAMAHEPFDPRVLGPRGERTLRVLVRRVSMHANKGKSASSWLTLGVLMQAQGRSERAEMMIERAVRSGLGADLARGFGVAMP